MSTVGHITMHSFDDTFSDCTGLVKTSRNQLQNQDKISTQVQYTNE